MKYKFNNFTGRLSAPSPLEIPSRFGKAAENPIIHYPQGTSFAKTLEGPKGFYGAVPRPLLQKMAMFQTLGAVAESPSITYPAGTTFPKELPPRKGIYGGVPGFLADKMRLFQSASPIPIHLKGGPTDKVLFASTAVLCAVGLTGCLSFFYDMSFPKKSED
ncbi:uncharacterized protein [Macrobrachium rosenbergii]|uniref:uncharacterized protein isoform X1 n=1 Tax=Macrobrachium rosenbergii TaxID=79674 RepID=UPI0034D6BEA3